MLEISFVMLYFYSEEGRSIKYWITSNDDVARFDLSPEYSLIHQRISNFHTSNGHGISKLILLMKYGNF